MKKCSAIKNTTAVAVLLSYLAVPALAERPRHRGEPDEPPVLVRIIKAAKRIFGISTTGDYPTVPNP